MLENHDIRAAYNDAYRHWIDKSEDFEHVGIITEMPTLACPEKFKKFRREYSVFQRNSLCVVEKSRLHLLSNGNLEDAINNAKVLGLELLAIDLQRCCGVNNREVSVLSKITSFIHPDKFNPMDQFAKIGITKISNTGLVDKFTTKRKASCYAEYCHQIDHILESDYFTKISNRLRGKPLPKNAPPAAFNRRILDTHLMRVGGRR
jgi:hypothetical protein